jgi:glutathione S-transferase
MEFVALVTLLLLFQYVVFMGLCGKARAKSGITAPAVTGDETFERAYRVQMNTIDQLIITLPAMWLSATYFMPMVAAMLGLLFFAGRMMYRLAYMRDPTSRGPGMMLGFLANIALILTATWGVGTHL